MATMSLDKQLQQFWPLLGSEQKKSILSEIKLLLKGAESQPTQRLTIDEYNKAQDEALARVRAGEFTTLEDAMKQAESW
jgi:hypothetical protein